MSENITVAIVIPAIAVVFGWIVWAVAVNIRRNRSARYSSEIQAKLLDRFTTNEGLVSFLEGSAGKRFFESLNLEPGDLARRLLNSVQMGIALFLLGASLLAVRTTQDQDLIRQVLLMIGAPILAIGLGLLISVFVSQRLSRAWGLTKRNESEN